MDSYDVIVVGSGHAGCEAALASARMGVRTCLFTLNLDTIALMPCNPSVGGPGKGHLVREIDALGGEMARNTDRTSIQIRQLNTSKGPAVRSLRAQCDKRAYSLAMKETIENTANLRVRQAAVEDLIIETAEGEPAVAGVIVAGGARFWARAVVLTTGTFLRGRIVVGDATFPAGRAGEFPADALSTSLARAGFRLGRLKTGTPPRIDARSIDFALTTPQPGSDTPLFFSHAARQAHRDGRVAAPEKYSPVAELGTRGARRGTLWREQLDCHGVQTNQDTHAIILRNLDRAPMYNGGITSTGPRYCPSIETKVVRFREKASHPIFLEPEGWATREVYVQGANTSLPEDVQLAMLRSIPALRQCEIMRAGYAIEYDYIPGTQVTPGLESKPLRNLFLAGQVIGTTGYEEAAGLGIMAGINASRRAQGRAPIVLRRDQAYIGVLIDDLVTKEMDEPYRMHTSQAEFRLLLREDNAERRLSPLGRELGLIGDARWADLENRQLQIRQTISLLDSTWISTRSEIGAVLRAHGCDPPTHPVRAREFLCRPDASIAVLQAIGVVPDDVPGEVAGEIETYVRYAGYVAKQENEVARMRRLEDRAIPRDIAYEDVPGLRSESREKLAAVRPCTVGQAARVGGVAPSDISLLLVHLERLSRQTAGRGLD